MKILVAGAFGMLGTDVVQALRAAGHQVLAPGLDEFDITNPTSIARYLTPTEGMNWCVNCAAYTAVDAAETHVDEVTAVNTLGPAYLSQACVLANARFIHISTDFVFDGNKSEPYVEEDPVNPLGVYGRTKLEGEEALSQTDAVVLRTAWLFGPHGRSFPRTMVEAARARKALRVVDDQIGSPTYTRDLAKTIVDVIETNLTRGLYHAAGPDVMSWHELATRAIQADRNAHDDPAPVMIEPISTEAWPTPARRPRYSALSSDKIHQPGIAPMRPITEALADFVKNLET